MQVRVLPGPPRSPAGRRVSLFAGDLTVTLTVGHGALTLAGTAGLSFTAGDGAGDASVTFAGSLAAINAALDGLSYAPGAEYSGADTLQITVDDGGAGGLGGALSAIRSIALTVTPVNNAPALANVAGSVSTIKLTPVRLDTDANVSDVDLDGLNGGAGLYTGSSLTIACSSGSDAQDSFDFDLSGAGFSVNGNALQSGGQTFATFTNEAGALTISFTSAGTAATSALVDDVVQHIAYTNTSSTPPAIVTLDYTFHDGSPGNGQGSGVAATATASKVVNISSVDSPSTGSVTIAIFTATDTTATLHASHDILDPDVATRRSRSNGSPPRMESPGPPSQAQPGPTSPPAGPGRPASARGGLLHGRVRLP